MATGILILIPVAIRLLMSLQVVWANCECLLDKSRVNGGSRATDVVAAGLWFCFFKIYFLLSKCFIAFIFGFFFAFVLIFTSVFSCLLSACFDFVHTIPQRDI